MIGKPIASAPIEPFVRSRGGTHSKSDDELDNDSDGELSGPIRAELIPLRTNSVAATKRTALCDASSDTRLRTGSALKGLSLWRGGTY